MEAPKWGYCHPLIFEVEKVKGYLGVITNFRQAGDTYEFAKTTMRRFYLSDAWSAAVSQKPYIVQGKAQINKIKPFEIDMVRGVLDGEQKSPNDIFAVK